MDEPLSVSDSVVDDERELVLLCDADSDSLTLEDNVPEAVSDRLDDGD